MRLTVSRNVRIQAPSRGSPTPTDVGSPLALDLLARMPMLALACKARRWEPRRLRLRPFSAATRLDTLPNPD